MGRIVLLFAISCLCAIVYAGQNLRQTIVFDKETPDVFYCPQEKPVSYDKMLVKAKSMKKLCEYEGRPLPKDYKSDCWQDVDESEFGCNEKHRIMSRIRAEEEENLILDNYVQIF